MDSSASSRSTSSADGLLLSSIDNNAISTTALLPSSITLTARRSVTAKRSLVWRYFRPLENNSYDVECILCTMVVSRKSTSTSNLLHHIQMRHDNEFQIVNKAMKSKSTALMQRLPLTSERSSQLTKLAADLIVSNLLPLSIVESAELQAIFQEAEPSYVLLKRKYFLGNVFGPMYDDDVRQQVQNELRVAVGKSKLPFVLCNKCRVFLQVSALQLTSGHRKLISPT